MGTGSGLGWGWSRFLGRYWLGNDHTGIRNSDFAEVRGQPGGPGSIQDFLCNWSKREIARASRRPGPFDKACITRKIRRVRMNTDYSGKGPSSARIASNQMP